MASQVNFPLAPGETLVNCPYDSAHKILNTRMLRHLTICRRNHIQDKKKKGEKVTVVRCRFNAGHHCPKAEIDFHEANCPDQESVARHLGFHQSEEFQTIAEAHQASNYQSSTNAEGGNDGNNDEADDWEKDTNGYEPAYDPSVRLQNGPAISIAPQGMTKSQRKASREHERLRFAGLQK